jgi:hypothetical protein
LKGELQDLNALLAENPTSGIPLGYDCDKIRLAMKSKGKEKSGGARVITHVLFSIRSVAIQTRRVYLLSIYDKSEFASLSDHDLQKLIKEITS